VAWGPGQALVMEDVEVAPPGPMEIRVKVVSTSICRSDVNQWQNTVRTGTATKQFLLSKSPAFAFISFQVKRHNISSRACLTDICSVPNRRHSPICSPESLGTKHLGLYPDLLPCLLVRLCESLT
jgi:hypothetical protein